MAAQDQPAIEPTQIPQAAIDAATAVLSSAGPCDNVYVHISHGVAAEVALDILKAAAPHMTGR